MDIDNILDDSGTSSTDIHISDSIKSYLAESARWAKFIAIVSFVLLGLGVISVLLGGGALLAAGIPGGGGGLIMLVYIIVIGITFIPIYYLYQFAIKTQMALLNDSQVALQDAFECHKSMFKFYGIFLAIMLGFYALVFIGGLLFAGL